MVGHIVNSWHEWLVDGRERRVMLVIETDLVLEPGEEGFNAAMIDELLEEATRQVRASPSPIDGIRIRPSR